MIVHPIFKRLMIFVWLVCTPFITSTARAQQAPTVLQCVFDSSDEHVAVDLKVAQSAFDWTRVNFGNDHRVWAQVLPNPLRFKALVEDDSEPRPIVRQSLTIPFSIAGTQANCEAPVLNQTLYTGHFEREVNLQCLRVCQVHAEKVESASSSNPVTEVRKREGTLKLLVVGDLMLDETPGAALRAGVDPFKPYKAWFDQADVRLANLESAVGDRSDKRWAKHKVRKPYTFMAHPRVLNTLSKYFDGVSLANNHVGDYGSAGIEETFKHLERAKLPYVGAGRNLIEAHQAKVFEVRGQRVAILAYDLFMPRSFEATDRHPGVAWGDLDYVLEDVRRSRIQDRADWVIVVPHWGWEYESHAGAWQRKWAQRVLDAGADAVVGGHPHVTQNVQLYDGKPIFYSLGNFVFNGFKDPATNTGWLLNLTLSTHQPATWAIQEVRLDNRGLPQPGRVFQNSLDNPANFTKF